MNRRGNPEILAQVHHGDRPGRPLKQAGISHEDRHADYMADFVLVDFPSRLRCGDRPSHLHERRQPHSQAEVFLQDGLRRQRTLTDQEGRYRFQQLPGQYEVYTRVGFGVKATVYVIGGETVNEVDFSPATERGGRRILRLPKENPGVIDEPVSDYGLLPPPTPQP